MNDPVLTILILAFAGKCFGAASFAIIYIFAGELFHISAYCIRNALSLS